MVGLKKDCVTEKSNVSLSLSIRHLTCQDVIECAYEHIERA